MSEKFKKYIAIGLILTSIPTLFAIHYFYANYPTPNPWIGPRERGILNFSDEILRIYR